MPVIRNSGVIFAERPEGYPIPGKHVIYDESATIDVDSVVLNGGILVKTLVFSIDPAIRGRMRVLNVGVRLSNFGLGRVIRSENPSYKVGDLVEGVIPMEEYTVIHEFRFGRIIKNDLDLPPRLYVGVAGMPGKTAYYGWKAYADAKKGETVFVTTGAGAVGSIVIQIAKMAGLKVIASAGSDDKVAWMKELGADVVFNYKTTDASEVLKKEGPINIYWDNVGGEMLDLALDNAASGARFIECGMISGYNGQSIPIKNLGQIIYKEIHIHGLYVMGELNQKYAAEFDQVFLPLIKEGKIKYVEDVKRGLENIGPAILEQQQGRNAGKSVVEVADE